MARRTLPGSAMQIDEIGPDYESTPEDFDQRLLFLYRILRRLSWDSVLPCHLQLKYIHVYYRRDEAEPAPATPRGLDDAIQTCKRLPMKPRDFGGLRDVSGHYRRLIEALLEKAHLDFGVRSFNDAPHADPHERHIHLGDTRTWISDEHGYPPPGCGLPVWAGEAVFEYAPGHWGCILADRTELVDERPHRQDADDHLLRSELLACVALLRRQMNKPVWESGHPVLCRNPNFMGWELDEKPGPVKVTVVTFTLYQARILQASCDASSSSPSLNISLRASYPLRDGRSSEEVARKILRWLLSRDQPWAWNMKKKTTASGTRVPSGGSESSRASQPSSVATDVSESNSLRD
ncbi:hypothetical protein B0T16DRAFT_461525 [Cercophora newfieldiana]|uniref:Uncharacterized protein n=1 Tax=Cercophora newfieldiana TaxID=92897 RepID=A0AA40CJR4_9PEZI|nr:hypothetical protein B0T16DRAFT_461525 [Cercophora newfieldiana]